MSKKKLKLDLKKITLGKLNNKVAENVKGGTWYTYGCGTIATGLPTEGSLPSSIGSAATCVFRYINTRSECIKES